MLYFSMWDGDESMRVIRKLVAQFEAENPDIEVGSSISPTTTPITKR